MSEQPNQAAIGGPAPKSTTTGGKGDSQEKRGAALRRLTRAYAELTGGMARAVADGLDELVDHATEPNGDLLEGYVEGWATTLEKTAVALRESLSELQKKE